MTTTNVALEHYEFNPEEIVWRNSAAPKMLHHITVLTGRLVDQIILSFTDGSAQTYGQPGGEHVYVFTLDFEHFEYVVRINGRQGDSLDGIQFVTNFGRTSAWFGGGGGEPFQFTVTSGEMMTALDSEEEKGWCPRVNGIIGSPKPKTPRRRSLLWLMLNRNTRRLALSGNPSLLRLSLRGKPSALRSSLKGTPSTLRMMFRGKNSFIRSMLTGEENKSSQSSLFRLLCTPGSYSGADDLSVMQVILDSGQRDIPSIVQLMMEQERGRKSVARLFLENRKNGMKPLYELLFERDQENGYPSIMQLVFERDHDLQGNNFPSIIDSALMGERGEIPGSSSLLRLMLLGRPKSIFHLFLDGEAEGKGSLMRMMVEDKKSNGLSITRRILTNFENAKGHRPAVATYFLLGEEIGRSSIFRLMVGSEARRDQPSLLNLLMYRYEYETTKKPKILFRMASSRITRSRQFRIEQKQKRLRKKDQLVSETTDEDDANEDEATQLWRKKSLLEVMMTGDPSIFDLFLDGELTGDDSLARLIVATSATFKDGRILLGDQLKKGSTGLSLFRMMLLGEEEGGPGISFLRIMLLGEQDNGFSILRLLLLNETTDEPSILRVFLTMFKTILVAAKQRKGDITQWKKNFKKIVETVTSSQKKRSTKVTDVVDIVKNIMSTGFVNYKELVKIIQTIPNRSKQLEGIWKAQFLKVARELELSSARATNLREWPVIAKKWSKLAEDIAYQRWTQVIPKLVNIGFDIGKLLPEAIGVMNEEMQS